MHSRRFGAFSRLSVILGLFFSHLTPAVKCDTLRCLLPRINGFDAEYERAIKYIGGSTTTDPMEMKVFVAVKGRELYVQSNYKRDGENNPTKLSSDEALPAGVSSALIQYLVNDKFEPSEGFSHIPIYLDESTFASSYFQTFDDSDNVTVIDGNGDKQQTATVLKFDNKRKRVVVGEDEIYYDPKSFADRRTLEHLRSRRFDGSSVSVLSLVNNTETARAFEVSIPSANDLNRELNGLDEAGIYTALRGKSGTSVIILGHIEESSFVTYTTDGTEVSLRVPIEKLKMNAQAANVNLFLLGCNSASATESGIFGTFNTVDAVTRLGTALKAETVGGFLSLLIPDGSHLVLRNDDLTGFGVDIHDKEGAQVGRIILPTALWVASTQSTLMEEAADVFSAIWHWCRMHWLVSLIVLIFLFRVLAR